MRDVPTVAAEGVKDLRKLAVRQQAVEPGGTELEDRLVLLYRLEPGLIGICRDETCVFEQPEAVGESRFGPLIVSSHASRVTSCYCQADLGFGFLGRIEEMGTHLEDLVIGHVEQAEAAACDSGVEAEHKIVAGVAHGYSSDENFNVTSIYRAPDNNCAPSMNGRAGLFLAGTGPSGILGQSLVRCPQRKAPRALIREAPLTIAFLGLLLGLSPGEDGVVQPEEGENRDDGDCEDGDSLAR